MSSFAFRRVLHRRLSDPVLLIGIGDWADTGRAVTLLTTTLLGSSPSYEVAAIIEAGCTSDPTGAKGEWTIYVLRDASDHEYLLLTGWEPSGEPAPFADVVVRLALELGAAEVVGLAAHAAPVPHTRQLLLMETKGQAELKRFERDMSATPLPAVVQTFIGAASVRHALPARILHVLLPDYAEEVEYPAGSLALLDAIERSCALRLQECQALERWQSGVAAVLDAMVGADPRSAASLRKREAGYDTCVEDGLAEHFGTSIPSGEALASALEKYLRGLRAQDEDDGGDR